MLKHLRDRRGFSIVEQVAAVAVAATASVVAVPVTLHTIANFRINGNAHAIAHHLQVAKLRAAANFTRSRLFVDLSSNSFHIDAWQKTGTPGWITEGGTEGLSRDVSFGVGGLTTPPANTQTSLAQAPLCLNDLGTVIPNTACVVFNSRGIPIDATTGVATADDALYITGEGGVFGITVSATSRVQLWWSAAGTAAWMRKQ